VIPDLVTREAAAPAVPEAAAADPDQEAAFELRLTHEILLSERFRVTLLALIPGLSMLVFLALSAAAPALTERLFGNKLGRLGVGFFLGGVSAYEFLSLRIVERMLVTSARPPAFRRYFNAFVEASLPTVVIVYYMALAGPVHALFLPPAFTYFFFILLSTLRLEFTLSAFTGLVAAVEYAAVAVLAVTTPGGLQDEELTSIPHHLAKAAILLASGVAAGFVARQLRKSFVNTLRSVEDRNRVVNVFGQHVSPAVVDRLLTAGAGARSELRRVCVMFADIRGFTAFSEDKSPEVVVGYLNAVFERIVESVNAHHGIVNKFLGDGCMAIFGAPLSEGNDCENATAAALEILARVDAEVEAGRLPPTRLGIALHAGEVVIGNVGSRLRKEYTVIGDVVNVASRVESLNKELGSRLLVTEEVWREATGEGRKVLAQTTLTVRGRQGTVQVYQLA
jgi:adenylate cyclase